MPEKNCRTPNELADETDRLVSILREDERRNPGAFEAAASKACDSTLARVAARIAGGPFAEPWTGKIQAMLDLREREREAKRSADPSRSPRDPAR